MTSAFDLFSSEPKVLVKRGSWLNPPLDCSALSASGDDADAASHDGGANDGDDASGDDAASEPLSLCRLSPARQMMPRLA